MSVGYCEGLVTDHSRRNWSGDGPRPLRWSMWYPADDGAEVERPGETSWFDLAPVARNAVSRLPETSHPVVLLSHGTGGIATGLEWLAHPLADAGFVALAVDHHGNTGSEPYVPEGFLCLWERALDLSVLLDSDAWRAPLRGPVADTAFVAGFSGGAYTALLLAGARVAFSQFEHGNPEPSANRGPREFPDLAEWIPVLLDKSATFRTSWDRRRASYKDNRIRAAIAIAPGRSVRGFAKDSLHQIDIQVHIIGAEADDVAPPSLCANWLHAQIARSSMQMIGGNAGHYVFLPRPSPLGLEQEPDYFQDQMPTDRKAIHESIASHAEGFFRHIIKAEDLS